MATETENIPVLKLNDDTGSLFDDVVAREIPLTIMLNGTELVTMLCTPGSLEYLTVGFLASEGFITSASDVKNVLVDETRGVVRVETSGERIQEEEVLFKRLITSGCGRGAAFYNAADVSARAKVASTTSAEASQITALVREFQHHSELYRSTGGVHSAALCDADKIIVFNEDIGRHNAVDKIFGECVMKGISTEGRIVVTSGRISSEILLKVARRNIPIIVSKSAPTDLGVKMAEDLGVTLLGFVRGKRLNVYTNNWRITLNGEPSGGPVKPDPGT